MKASTDAVSWAERWSTLLMFQRYMYLMTFLKIVAINPITFDLHFRMWDSILTLTISMVQYSCNSHSLFGEPPLIMVYNELRLFPPPHRLWALLHVMYASENTERGRRTTKGHCGCRGLWQEKEQNVRESGFLLSRLSLMINKWPFVL